MKTKKEKVVKQEWEKADQLDTILEACGQLDNHDLNYLLRDYFKMIISKEIKKERERMLEIVKDLLKVKV
jgi:hypothetical protein